MTIKAIPLLLAVLLLTALPAAAFTEKYQINVKYRNQIPFDSAHLYDPINKEWYNVYVYYDIITVTDKITYPAEVKFYPTKKQMKEINVLRNDVEQDGFTFYNKIRLFLLYKSIKQVK